MKFKQFLYVIAICTASSLLWMSCKKNDTSFSKPTSNEANLKLSGVVADDPSKVAKIPMLISTNFLNQYKETLLADPLALSGYVNSQALNSLKGAGSDRTAPTVSITSPTSGSTVAGTVTIQVSASDNVGVSNVTVSVDGIALANKSAVPYSFTWNTSGFVSGTHTISAMAKDAAGNNKSVSVQVGISATPSGDVTAPVTNITSPTSGSAFTAGAIISVAVNATDNLSVSSVSFIVDGALQSTSSTSPYSFSWNTTGAASGTHTLTATAKDAAGNSSSSSIPVTVNTTVIPPTTLPSSYQLSTPAIQDQGGEGSCVPFAVGYVATSVSQYYQTSATSYNFSTNVFSPEFIYNQIKTSDCGSGTGVINALNFLVNTGVCSWQSMPYSSSNGCSLFPTSSQTSEAANYKITGYSSVPVSDIIAIKTMLINKHAVIITIATDNSFWAAQPGFIWNHYSGPMGISHCLAICGYDDTKHAYKVMNSWGTTWGDAGFSWIDYDFLPQSAAYYAYVIN